MVAELRAGSRFPGEGGDVGVAQPQRGRRWDRGQPTRERAGGVKLRQRIGEHACSCSTLSCLPPQNVSFTKGRLKLQDWEAWGNHLLYLSDSWAAMGGHAGRTGLDE
ncbi:hypothetical protein CapIbe_020991 [Capra ibex]